MSPQKYKSKILKFAPVFAFLGYGSWASEVNYWSQSHSFLVSGVIQGLYAFTVTLILRLTVLKIHQQFQSPIKALFYTFIISFILMVSIPAIFHYIFATKEIFYSILPGAIIGGIYLILILKYEINPKISKN